MGHVDLHEWNLRARLFQFLQVMMVAVGFSAHGAGKIPGVAERRLKGSIGSSVHASLRDARPFPTIVPWAQAHGYLQAVAPRLPKK